MFSPLATCSEAPLAIGSKSTLIRGQVRDHQKPRMSAVLTDPRRESPGTDSSTSTLGSQTTMTSVSQAMSPSGSAQLQRGEDRTVGCRKKFLGETVYVFTADEEQKTRHKAIVEDIIGPVNTVLGEQGSSGGPAVPVSAIRLIVMSSDPDIANSKPYIVFFCSTPDVEKRIKRLLQEPRYQEVAKCEGCPRLSFSYKTLVGGISARVFTSQFIARVPKSEHYIKGECGTPLRLYRSGADPEHWRRATLGGVMMVSNDDGVVEYLALTAGHAIDGWVDDTGTGSETIDSTARDSAPAEWQETTEHSFVVSAGSTSENTPFHASPNSENKQYLDWALFRLDGWETNATSGNSHPHWLSTSIKVRQTEIKGPMAGRVRLITGSKGVIYGKINDDMAQIAIGPGTEVVDVYIIVLEGEDTSISDGDSGSWVVSTEGNELLGHIVASDILGDVYVMPIEAILEDIRMRLTAGFSISLPGPIHQEKATGSPAHHIPAFHGRADQQSKTTPDSGPAGTRGISRTDITSRQNDDPLAPASINSARATSSWPGLGDEDADMGDEDSDMGDTAQRFDDDLSGSWSNLLSHASNHVVHVDEDYNFLPVPDNSLYFDSWVIPSYLDDQSISAESISFADDFFPRSTDLPSEHSPYEPIASFSYHGSSDFSISSNLPTSAFAPSHTYGTMENYGYTASLELDSSGVTPSANDHSISSTWEPSRVTYTSGDATQPADGHQSSSPDFASRGSYHSDGAAHESDRKGSSTS